MQLNAFFGYLLLLFYVEDIEGKTHAIIRPKLFRIDVPERITVNVIGYGQAHTRVVALLKDGQNVIRQTGITSIADQPIRLDVQVPGNLFHQDNLRSKMLTLHIRITFPGSGHQTIDDVTEIGVIGDRSQIFVLTDRPIYRPEERVHIRIAALDHMFLPLPEAELEVSINLKTDGERIGIWKKTVPVNGHFTNLRYNIPERAPLESYIIVVKRADKDHTQEGTAEFKVDKYVLPTFSVKTTLESNIVQPGGTIRGNIVARYTYGEYVLGKYSVEAQLNIPGRSPKTFYRRPADPSRHIPGLMEGENAGRGFVSITVERVPEIANSTWLQLIEFGATITIIVSVRGNAGGTTERDITGGILIATSPYNIDLSETSKFFVPSLEHNINLVVRDVVTGKPVEMVHRIAINYVNPVGREHMPEETDAKGRATITIPTLDSDNRFQLRISTGSSNAILNLAAHNTAQGYLKMSAPSYGEVDKIVTVTFVAKGNLPVKVYYMILCRGDVLRENSIFTTRGHISRGTLDITVTREMSPKIRVVAYYINGDNIFSDSLSILIDEVCLSRELTINVQPAKIAPGERTRLTIIGEPRATVSLIAVNRAAYFLNAKGRLTRGDMFQKMNDMDMGCSLAGGASTVDIFENAGLGLSSKLFSTSDDRSLNCSEDGGRSRTKRNAVDSGSDANDDREAVGKKCYANGRVENLAGLNCDERFSVVQECNIDFLDFCLENFRTGCDDGEELRRRSGFRKKFARSNSPLLDVDSDTPQSSKRERFADRWLFRELPLEENGLNQIMSQPPDSITAYDVSGFSVHQSKGICVSKPAELTVFKEVFIHFYLPYSVKLNEAIQIRAAIFNYRDTNLQVHLDLKTDDYLCTRASQGRWNHQGEFNVKSQSSTSFLFMAVPVKVPSKGEFSMIEARLIENGRPLDEIVQPLRIEPPGELKEFSGSFSLDPKVSGKTHTIGLEFPDENIIEESKECQIFGFMTNLGPLVEFSPIDEAPANLGDSVRLPGGCGEQNMKKVAPNVFIFIYLQTDNDFSLSAQEKVKTYIKDGYARQLTHRNNGKFAIWSTAKPTIWINAYVNKVFTHAQYVWPEINLAPICASWEWVFQQQNPDTGVFTEPYYSPYYWVNVADGGDLALTAYVLISMAEIDLVCSDGSFSDRMADAKSRAANYLRDHYREAQNAYTFAIVAYALSTVSTVGATLDVNQRLLNLAKRADDEIYWISKTMTDLNIRNLHKRKQEPINIEATAYGLLAQVKIARSSGNTVDAGTRELINGIARWMVGQQNDRGGFKTSQTTVVAIQSLVEYTKWMDEIEPPPRDPRLAMTITADSDSWGSGVDFLLDRRFRKHRKSLKVPKDVLESTKTITVAHIHGDGVGVLSYRCTYRTTIDREVCDYNIEVETHMLEDDLAISLSITKKSEGNSGMANIEFSLLSGYIPNEDSCKLIWKKDSVDGVVDYYEIYDGKIIFYVDHIPDVTQPPLRFGFKLTKVAEISNVNPAQIHIYDYYNPEKSQCTEFYTLPGEQPSMLMDCKADGTRCKCLEGKCVHYRNRTEQVDNTYVRGEDIPCPGCKDLKAMICAKNYAYTVEVLEIDFSMPLFAKIKSRIDSNIYQRDNPDAAVAQDDERTFVLKTDCYGKCIDMKGNYSIKVGSMYLIAGGLPIAIPNWDGQMRYDYWLHEEDVIEKTIPLATCTKASKAEKKFCKQGSSSYNPERCEKAQNRIKICQVHFKLRNAIEHGCD